MQLTDEQLKILKVAGVDYGVHVESTHVYATNGEILGACGGQTDSAPCDLQPDMITPMRRAFPCVSHLLDVNRYNVVMAVDARNLRTIASIFVAIAEKVGKRQPVVDFDTLQNTCGLRIVRGILYSPRIERLLCCV